MERPYLLQENARRAGDAAGEVAPLTGLLMQWLDLIQWPAMAVTVFASWCVASKARTRRRIGFWLFLLSNLLWVAWAIPARAWALVALQICLAFTNIRGERRNESG